MCPRQVRTGALKARHKLAQGKRSAALGYGSSKALSPVRAAQEKEGSFLRGASPPGCAAPAGKWSDSAISLKRRLLCYARQKPAGFPVGVSSPRDARDRADRCPVCSALKGRGMVAQGKPRRRCGAALGYMGLLSVAPCKGAAEKKCDVASVPLRRPYRADSLLGFRNPGLRCACPGLRCAALSARKERTARQRQGQESPGFCSRDSGGGSGMARS